MDEPRRGERGLAGPARRLFLDDDPGRAALFLAEYPDAVWVQAVPECIERLREAWDEVHLDHDLGGEHHVEMDRDDCGMAIVRWLGLAPRCHLRSTRFVVHSHNAVAAYLMVLRMKALGLEVVASPFGRGRWKPRSPRGLRGRFIAWLGGRKRGGVTDLDAD